VQCKESKDGEEVKGKQKCESVKKRINDYAFHERDKRKRKEEECNESNSRTDYPFQLSPKT
jgi:hypothetical protein